MLPQANSYAELIEKFEWHVPEYYNIGVDVCDKWADREPERLALLHKRQDGAVERYTFADMKALSNQTAHLLQQSGVERGDRVAVLLPQAPETGYAHVAIYKLGAIAVPLFTLFGVDALQYRLSNCGAKAVITNKEGVAKIQQIRERLPDLRLVFSIDGAHEADESDHILDFHVQRHAQLETFAPVRTLAEDPALIIYTSGTTGPPKGALHAHRTLIGHLPGVEMSHNLFPQPGDRIWTPADWAWIGGLYDVLMPAWHHGITVVSHRFRKFDAEAAFAFIAEFGIRNAFLPPTALKMMRKVKDPHTRWNYNMRTIASGGETLGAELLEWGASTFALTINEFYGQTECNMIVSSCSAIMEARPGIMGRAVPGHELAIIDHEGKRLPNGQLGQIAAKRPNPVMLLEYWNHPQATEEKFIGDWLITGDQGIMDDEQYIRFVGRNDDVINSSGYRIGPGEIEDCLLSHPAVKMAAVIGVPDDTRNELIKAFIVLDEGHSPSDALVKAIQAHVKVRLAAHEYPRLIQFIDDFPLTTTSKIMRRKLRELE